ncbi:hypothetical protein HAX54_008846 [Datura stramonium]|uniref:Uncharacterized protein n=1 Tax=Datura stramonium TaxID=4076 RepID=A0ABS8RVX2_DATST|nr:hypothetical protein [Datura stramonium]
MATLATGQPPPTMADQHPIDAPIIMLSPTKPSSTILNITNILNVNSLNNVKLCPTDLPRISYKPITMLHDNSQFTPKEETTMAIDWISFLNLSPTYFVKERLFSLATIIKMRQSCKGMVLLYIIANVPDKVRMDKEDESTGSITTIKIGMQLQPSKASNQNNKKKSDDKGDQIMYLNQHVALYNEKPQKMIRESNDDGGKLEGRNKVKEAIIILVQSIQ